MAKTNVKKSAGETRQEVVVPFVPFNPNKPWKLVTHFHPDTDALLCLWLARKEYVKQGDYTIAFVPAGEALPNEERAGFNVLHFDTGGGEFDQHGKYLERSSSFQLLANKLDLGDDPGIKAFLELTRKADNVEKIDSLSLHYLLGGMAYHFREESGKVDWNSCVDMAFAAFDIHYGQICAWEAAKKEFEKYRSKDPHVVCTLRNGLVIAQLLNTPNLRSAAFAAGADVVVWTKRKKNGLHVGIQADGRNPRVQLFRLIEDIRSAEARKRGIRARGEDLRSLRVVEGLGAWFLHDSGNLIGCGTKTHPLGRNDEFTKLSSGAVFSIVRESLGKLNPK